MIKRCGVEADDGKVSALMFSVTTFTGLAINLGGLAMKTALA